MSLKILDIKIKKNVELQEYYLKRKNYTRCTDLGNKISGLMKEREEILEDIYANEETCITWWYDEKETGDGMAVLEDCDE